MWRRPPPDQSRSPRQQRALFLALSLLLLACLPLADAEKVHPGPHRDRQPAAPPAPLHHDDDGQQLSDDLVVQRWAATPIEEAYQAREIPPKTLHFSPHAKQQPLRHGKAGSFEHNGHSHDLFDRDPVRRGKNTDTQAIITPDDASALATLAPALSVRAPHPPRHLGPSSASASGTAPPQIARSLEDWEVEDFVLLATVDGDLYANDRKTGQELWHLEVDQPMVETMHLRTNSSVLDEDYSPVDHYIWAVEPNRDGGLYVWIPDSSAGLVRTGFTMKRLVEELAPYADEEPPVVYTGDKKTNMVTLDAATGRVIKWFGPSGSHVNEAESCLRQDTLSDKDVEECSSTGTITLGRTEYTVGIQRRDGRPIATLKYSEWGPNNYDSDLWQQHHSSMDSRYITSQHDGKVYAFDWTRADSASPLFSQKFSAPVARVFDVCRPWDAPRDSNPELVVLPQPPMPSQDEGVARMRSNSIFLNQTVTGSWYAMSGRAYPLIIDAPAAQSSRPGWWDSTSGWETISDATVSKALVGTHFLESLRASSPQPPSLPPGQVSGPLADPDNDSTLPLWQGQEIRQPNLIAKVKSLPQTAANTVIDFISNPIVIVLFVVTLILNEKKLRRAYRRFRDGGEVKDALLTLYSEASRELPGKTAEEPAPTNQARKTGPSVAENQVEEVDKDHAQGGLDSELPADAATTSSSEDAQRVLPAHNRVAPASPAVKKPEQKPEATLPTNDSPADNGTKSGKTKKAHRGTRGGVKHRKGQRRAREGSQSREEDASLGTIDEAVKNAKKLGDAPNLEPDVVTVNNDMQTVSGPIIKMGNIEVNTEDQLGTGSNGTLVFAGKFDGRDVAVKRMLIQFYDIASQETRLLRESDDHPNVIRYYSQQIRDGFLFIALERCAASLADVVEKPHHFRSLAEAGQLDLPGILYQITNGIDHLHSLRIVHRDLKPQNILVNMGKDGKPRMLVSDFGLCKKLEGGQSSFGATTGRAAGTTGWRAPELLLDDDARDAGAHEVSTHSGSGSVLVGDGVTTNTHRATRAIDIFSLGLVFFYVLTNGSHPFDCGDRYMREVNIRKGNYSLRMLDSFGDWAYEAKDLIGSMLEADPKNRPTTRDVMSHPFFWSVKKRLAFLCDVSDHFEKESRDPPSEALCELERHAMDVTKGDFLRALPREFVESLGKQRKYTGSRLLDMLRALRNKRNHYEDMPETLKRTVGPLPEGYLGFWTRRFPMLLLVCWDVVYKVRWDETDRFREYYLPAGP